MLTSELTQKIYHEKQRRQLCLLHTLNNLFQKEEFTQSELDTICESLDDNRWLNAHRSWLGLGNYDANVLIAAISLRNLATVWFDSRYSANRINFDVVDGYIFNIPSATYIPFYKGRHWIQDQLAKRVRLMYARKIYKNFFEAPPDRASSAVATRRASKISSDSESAHQITYQFAVRKLGSHFYNLDSKLPQALRIDDFIVFANRLLADGNQLLLVTKPECEDRCIQRDAGLV